MDFPPNQEAFNQMIHEVGEQMIRAGQQLQKNSQRAWFDFQRQSLIAKELSEVFSALAKQPELMTAFQEQLADAVNLDNLNESDLSDRRFSDDAWQQPGFLQLKTIYLNFCNASMQILDQLSDIEPTKRERTKFFFRQWLSAISPSNYLMTNPQAIAKTQETGGANLVNGMTNYFADLERSEGVPNIRMTDLNAFTPGKNIAATAGEVIYQNELMQLIQYAPVTEQVYEKPLLIVPPWINKYYILDLQEGNSLINWLVTQGQTVFVISWVNPTAELSHKDFSDYMKQGVLEALDAIENTLGTQSINTLGYCLGGTLLATALAFLKHRGDQRVNSATFLTTLLDFTYPGELGHFLSEEQLDILHQQLQTEGVLSGHLLTATYNMLRENDLHWSYHVNNYLLGNEPPVFDLLYWNSDATNLPAAMHYFYLKNMYLENKLKEPGGIVIDDVEIDLGQIDQPCFFLSAQKDHIALWQSTYLGMQRLSGNKEFVLAGSGHVAGVINPADSGKYSYFKNNSEDLDNTPPEQWLTRAESVKGSWWPYWRDWLAKQAGEKTASRGASEGKLAPIEPAPGSYVMKRLS